MLAGRLRRPLTVRPNLPSGLGQALRMETDDSQVVEFDGTRHTFTATNPHFFIGDTEVDRGAYEDELDRQRELA